MARTYFELGQWDVTLASPGQDTGRVPLSKGKGIGPPHERFVNAAARQAVEILEQLVKDYPKEPEYLHLLACCYREAVPLNASVRTRAVEVLRQLVRDYPRVPDYLLDLCETLAPPRQPMLAASMSERLVEEAIQLSRQLVQQYPNVPAYAAAHARYHDYLATTLYDLGKYNEAVPIHRKAVELQKRLVAQYPEVVTHEFWLSLMERSLGRTLTARGEAKESRMLLHSAVSRAEALRKKDPRLGGVSPFLGMAYRELATALRRDGEPHLAAEAQRKAEEFPSPTPSGKVPPLKPTVRSYQGAVLGIRARASRTS